MVRKGIDLLYTRLKSPFQHTSNNATPNPIPGSTTVSVYSPSSSCASAGTGDVDADAGERGRNVQVHFDRVGLDGRFVVGQVLAVAVDAGVANDFERDDGVLVLGLDEAEDGKLVNAALHGENVWAGLEDEVGDERVADGLAVQEQVHGDVAEIERHDRRVGDVDVADEVGAIGENGVLAGEDFDVGDVETSKFV